MRVLLISAVILAVCGPVRAQAAPPNVVIIISDDQAWTDFGFMGHDGIRTPSLDRLASQSALFTRGYVPTSMCRPSLATMITGLYPHQHGITSNDPAIGIHRSEMQRQFQQHATLPGLLAPEGYLSLQTGKWWEGTYRLGGFSHGMTETGRHGGEGLKIGREGLEPVFRFIRDRGERPFFVWYAPMMPHTPHTPPERLLAKYCAPGRSPRVAAYWAMCEWFDETCGELLDFLDREGLSPNTLVVFVVDNGWIQRQDIQWFAPRSKMSPYEAGIRTPILLRWPGHIEPARDEKTLVSTIDLAPTILCACGVEPPAALPGINLLDVCRGKRPERDAVFGATFTHNAFKTGEPAADLMHRWCVARNWKLILPEAAAGKAGPFGFHPDPRDPRELADRRPVLYDVLADPHEQHERAGDQPQVVTHLRERIDAWWRPVPRGKPVDTDRTPAEMAD